MNKISLVSELMKLSKNLWDEVSYGSCYIDCPIGMEILKGQYLKDAYRGDLYETIPEAVRWTHGKPSLILKLKNGKILEVVKVVNNMYF